MNQHNKEIFIEVISDIVCPWCYVGKKQLDNVLGNFKTNNFLFRVIWQPFELNPNFPEIGMNRKSYLKKKFGDKDWEQSVMAKSLLDHGDKLGISFNFNNIKIMPNSRIVHSVIDYSKKENKDKDLIEQLFKDFFEDGINISDIHYLIKIAEKFKLNKELIFDCVNGKNNNFIADQEQKYIELGVSSVPCFIINKKFAISGAQGEKNITNFIRMVTEKIV